MACDVCDKRLAYALKHLWWWAEAEVNSEVGADRVFSTFDELPPPARISAGGAKSQVALGVASPAEKLAAEVIEAAGTNGEAATAAGTTGKAAEATWVKTVASGAAEANGEVMAAAGTRKEAVGVAETNEGVVQTNGTSEPHQKFSGNRVTYTR